MKTKRIIIVLNYLMLFGNKTVLNNSKMIIDGAKQKDIPLWYVNDQLKTSKELYFPSHKNIFVKDELSCFSVRKFKEDLCEISPEEVVFIGSSSADILRTIFNGLDLHFSCQFTVIEDASIPMIQNEMCDERMHRSTLDVLKPFARIMSSKNFLAEIQIKAPSSVVDFNFFTKARLLSNKVYKWLPHVFISPKL